MKYTAIALFFCMFWRSVSSHELASPTKDLPYFLDRLTHENMWLAPHPDEKNYLASSHQPKRSRDCNKFLRTEQENGVNWQVLVDIKGPGVVTRFWTPDFDHRLDGDLQIYIDGALVLSTTLAAFFQGNVYPFLTPLVVNETLSSGGRISYFPIPFDKSIKIRSNSTSDSFYWQINYSLFSASVVRSFSLPLTDQEKIHVDNTLAQFSQPKRWEHQNLKETFWTLTLGAKAAQTQTMTGQGIIRQLSVSWPAGNVHWKNLWVKGYVDGESSPSIDAGLPDLVHLMAQEKNYQSRYTGMENNLLYFTVPIPLQSSLTMTFINLSEQPVQDIQVRLFLDDQQTSSMRLHAHTQTLNPLFGDTITLAQVQGKGVLLGFNLLTVAPAAQKTDFFNQEGDEYIYADGSLVWKGTGTEDYFNAGYYYAFGTFAQPLHGCLHKDTKDGGSISAYRFQKLDAVRFDHQLTLDLEAGCPLKGKSVGYNGAFTLSYRTTVFYYLEKQQSGVSEDIGLEAECGSIGVNWKKVSDTSASGGAYVTVKNGYNSPNVAPSGTGGIVSFSVTIPQAGSYYLYARVKAPNGGDNSFWVRVDNSSWILWSINTYATSFSWRKVKNSPFTFNTAGNHTVQFAYREDGTHLDKVSLSLSNVLPTGTGPAAPTCNTSPSSARAMTFLKDEEKPLPFEENLSSDGPSVKIFPNPTEGSLILQLTGIQLKENSLLTVLNQQGEIIWQIPVTVTVSVMHLTLPGLAPGIYLIQIPAENNIIRKRIEIL